MFYGWWIVLGVFVTQLFSQGFLTYGFTLLVSPVQAEFGASRAEVVIAVTFGGVAGLLISPIVGQLVDRWSVRRLMIIGTLVLAAGWVAMSLARSVPQFVASYTTLMSIANILLGPVTSSALISRWFTASRGRALGVAAIGISVGGIALPPLMQHWIATASWRGSLRNLALCAVVGVLPLVLVSVRDDPADRGLEPEGGPEPAPSPAPGGAAEASMREVLAQPPFWLIGVCMGLLFFVYVGVMTNLGPYATSLSIEGTQTAGALSLLAVCGVVGKLAFGHAADRIDLRIGLWLALALAAAGAIVLALGLGLHGLYAAAALFGLASGGMVPIWGAMIAAVFGTARYGRVMGLMMPLVSTLIAPGALVAGAMADATGSYAIAFFVFAGILAAAAGLLVPLKIPQPG